MTVFLFGATGLIGHGALNAALSDDRVSRVVSVVRRPSDRTHDRLEEIVHDDFFDFSAIEERFAEADTCLFSIGISSVGQSEAHYRRITYDLTLAAARAMARQNPSMTFVFVSGLGTDLNGRQMWARVKGETEAALSALPFRAVYHARPGFVQPMGGAHARQRLYRAIYAVTALLHPVLRRIAPKAFIDSEALGRALVEAGLAGAPETVLEMPTLHLLAKRAEPHHPA